MPVETWPSEQIKDLLLSAQQLGSATAKTSSPRDAELLRFAIYNFRKRNEGFDNLKATLDGEYVVVKRFDGFTIVDETSTEEE